MCMVSCEVVEVQESPPVPWLLCSSLLSSAALDSWLFSIHRTLVVYGTPGLVDSSCMHIIITHC